MRRAGERQPPFTRRLQPPEIRPDLSDLLSTNFSKSSPGPLGREVRKTPQGHLRSLSGQEVHSVRRRRQHAAQGGVRRAAAHRIVKAVVRQRGLARTRRPSSCVDGAFLITRASTRRVREPVGRDGVGATVRESTRRVSARRRCRDGICTTQVRPQGPHVPPDHRRGLRLCLRSPGRRPPIFIREIPAALQHRGLHGDAGTDSVCEMNLNLSASRRWRRCDAAPPRRRRCGCL